MPRYFFTGLVRPERAALTLHTPEPLQIEVSDSGIRCDVQVMINLAHVSIIVDSQDPLENLHSIKNVVQYLTSGLVDAVGYVYGAAYELEIASVTTETGEHIIFGGDLSYREEWADARPVDAARAMQLSLIDENLRRALAELRLAIAEPIDTGFHAYRAAEAIRRHFQSNGETESIAWSEMRKALRLREGLLRGLMPFALDQRHGGAPSMSADEQRRHVTDIWKVIDRYVILLDRALDELSPGEYEEL